jgi:hypothetical protein
MALLSRLWKEGKGKICGYSLAKGMAPSERGQETKVTYISQKLYKAQKTVEPLRLNNFPHNTPPLAVSGKGLT